MIPSQRLPYSPIVQRPPLRLPGDARVVVWRKFARALRVDLNEQEIAPIDLINGREARLNVRGKEIVTLRFEE